jgi:predicted GH43/DUF377 family glycosyl hydrolase
MRKRETMTTNTNTDIDLRPDPTRVILRFFVPGCGDIEPSVSRAGSVIDRVLALSEDEVESHLVSIYERFNHRHLDLERKFIHHAELASVRLDPEIEFSKQRFLLLGAAFSHEFSIEGAALCNPSIVALPSASDGVNTRFVMSLRCIGEGHRSSIGFCTGEISPDGLVHLDPRGSFAHTGTIGPGTHHRGVMHRKLYEVDNDHENADYVLDPLPECFDDDQLSDRLEALIHDAATRRHAEDTSTLLRRVAAGTYSVEFPNEINLVDRVLWPEALDEHHGMEDARFVEITDGSAPRYCATYTAFDGNRISQYLITTEDFLSFNAGPIAGDAASGKGLALFPRQIGGRFVALSRADRENNALAYSDDLRCWDTAEPLQSPERPWEVVQLGNCGSPIETERGWLVLTHGVGPMRTYSIGALLLDLENPAQVIASTTHPIISPRPDQQNGYVPNVVYTCGALAVGDHLVIPYGIGDQRISVVVLSIQELLDSMEPMSTSSVLESF